jgi:4a-hydroxytetrahydrobiopterin dehydratase
MIWREENNALHTELKFIDFSQAWAFMNEVAIASEKMNHHPEWSNVWNSVEIKLTTHDAGNTVTEKDRKLAEKITLIYKRYIISTH